MNTFLATLSGFLLFLAVTTLPVKAATIETTYGLFPGGFSFSESGIDPASGVKTWNLSPTDPAQFDQAWFAFDPISAGMDGAGSLMTLFSGLGTGTAVWTGNDSWVRFNGTVAIETRFTATITTGQSWIDPSTVGIAGPGSPPTVAELGSLFSVDFWFEARTIGGTWMSHLNLYNSVNNCGLGCSGNSKTDAFTRYFYTEPAAVPLPAAFPLLGGGLVLMGFLGFRRKRSA